MRNKEIVRELERLLAEPSNSASVDHALQEAIKRIEKPEKAVPTVVVKERGVKA